ncbi:fumarylacetoacetate hydrolase family protein [Roseivivax marinus]|uniref:fumarylacetoacetate hydrolase family protein n=1 Tax=Roseivivax marinus TaxID=1379903 RepID=UPI001F04CB70|nr:fumarylacetoacetate hydrolase family protein [Roseivivax marinus]UMA64395.1 fumarylacetoacetate hydrolase family protein [Roseivivax marinus]
MKLLTVVHDGQYHAGYLEGDEVVVCGSGSGALRAVIEQGETLETWASGSAKRLRLADVTLAAPIPEPRRDIFCVGKNYFAHANEFHSSGFDSTSKEAVPKAPVIFTKATTSVCASGETVLGSLDPTASVDYEGELAVIIGTGGRSISKADAYDHVFGYTIVNDVTSRELQKTHGQWVIGKGIDTFCPMGPWIVTRDEAAVPEDMELVTEINGETRQQARVDGLVFDIPTLIETMSRTMTLLPGDIIATGTPEGVGIGFKPPRYLKAGDTMRVSVTGLGSLENKIG